MIKFFPSLLLKDYLLGIILIRKKKVKYTRVIDSAIFFFFFWSLISCEITIKERGGGGGRRNGCTRSDANLSYVTFESGLHGSPDLFCDSRVEELPIFVLPRIRPFYTYIHGKTMHGAATRTITRNEGFMQAESFRVLETMRPPSPSNKIKP